MSFGGPGGGQVSYKPTPPERGSFPLDHDGEQPQLGCERSARWFDLLTAAHAGECKPIVVDYLRCLRRLKGTNDQECRMMAKDYLKCRMDHNLMARDELKNLGFAEEAPPAGQSSDRGTTAHTVQDEGKPKR